MFRSISLVLLTLVTLSAGNAFAEMQDDADGDHYNQCEAIFAECTDSVREDLRLCYRYTVKDFVCDDIIKPNFLSCLDAFEDCDLPPARIVSQ
ncbi:MAG: hypothetical protein J0M12_10505 [Deltaproteobacteria bacterium]|nr:hypothetical protein [Deltaproteobacteria bacterium]